MSKRKILLISAMCVLAVYIAMWFLCPLVNPKAVYWIADEDGLIDLDYYKSAVVKPDAAAQQIKSDQLFPSDEVKDYCTVVVGISAINISPFQLSNFGLMVDYQDENSNGVIVLPPIFPSQQGKAFSKVQERYMTSFLVYRNGKTDEEIISELQKVEVILYYDTVIKSYFKRVKLSDLSYQIMDDWYSYPKGWDVPVEAIPEGAEGIE